MIKIVVTFLFILITNNAFACSPALSTTTFVITGEKSTKPVTPTFKLTKVTRGKRGTFSSCADTGFIVLTLDKIPKNPQGYFFEIVEGVFDEKNLVSGPIKSISNQNAEFIFPWLDGNSNTQEPFDIKLKITGVSLSGAKSKPQFIQIAHEGVSVPWWNLWKKLPASSFTQAIEYD